MISSLKSMVGELEKAYGLRRKSLFGKTDDEVTITMWDWIEQLLEQCHDYEPQIILNLNKLGLCFKALPKKRFNREKKAK